MKAKVANPESLQELCQNCEKPTRLCVCSAIKPVNNKIEVLILQHPQEPDKELGTARIAQLSLKNCKLSVGLSWPNLEKALGHATDRKSWGVLYLGNKEATEQMRAQKISIAALSKKGNLHENSKTILKGLTGLIALDGTWSQAKTLWWRNAWLTKLTRIALFPSTPSIYGKLRREPRKESLSTLESIGFALDSLDQSSSISTNMLLPFQELLKKYKQR